MARNAIIKSREYSVSSYGEEYPQQSSEVDEICSPNRENKPGINPSQWSLVDDCIISVSSTMPKLEPGYYTIHSNNTLGLYFRNHKLALNKLYRLPNAASDLILSDISKFWTLEETYKKYQRVFRRNYLLYSAPGTGKTSLINLMCEDLINKYKGVVFSIDSEYDLQLLPDAIRRVRQIEPERRIICIIEDIDAYTQSSNSNNGMLLNILDGNMKFNGLVIIATTNHIEYLEDRYTNRPSRFDRVVEFPLPNAESRKMFLEKTVLPDDINKIDLDAWVKRTEGFTIDHINELILLFFVFNHTEEESFAAVESMIGTKGRLSNKSSVNKKSLGF